MNPNKSKLIGKTSIAVSKATLEKLTAMKLTEEQSHDELINLLINGKALQLMEIKQLIAEMQESADAVQFETISTNGKSAQEVISISNGKQKLSVEASISQNKKKNFEGTGIMSPVEVVYCFESSSWLQAD